MPDPTPALPNPDPIVTVDVTLEIMKPDRLPAGDEWVRYGMTVEQYQNLSRNMAEILRWVREAQWRLDYYAPDSNTVEDETDRKDSD